MYIVITGSKHNKWLAFQTNLKMANKILADNMNQACYIFMIPPIEIGETSRKLVLNYPFYLYYSNAKINNYHDILEEEDAVYIYITIYSNTKTIDLDFNHLQV